LTQLAGLWAEGINDLQQARDLVEAERLPELERELGVASCVFACVTSTVHVARFYLARTRLAEATDGHERAAALQAMIDVAEAEQRNCQAVLPVLRADSRLGYANSAGSAQQGVPRGGMFNAATVEKKLAHLAGVMRDLHDLARSPDLARTEPTPTPTPTPEEP
jgi:hypothetical protein